MKRNLLFIFLLLCPYVVQAQVELHPKYSSPNMGNGAKLSNDGSKVVAWGGYGFSVWDVQSGKMVYTVNGHLGRVNYAEFNNSGTAIVTASDDYTAKIWNAHNGELIHTLKAHTNLVCYAKFNATDDRIITLDEDGNAVLWNVHNGRIVANLSAKDDGYMKNVYFNKKGDKIIMYTNYGMIRISDAQSGLALYEYDMKKVWIQAVRFNAEGNKIYVKKNDSLLILTVNTDFEKVKLSDEFDTVVKSKSKYHCCFSGDAHGYCNKHSFDVCTNDKYIIQLKKGVGMIVEDILSGETILKEEYRVMGDEFIAFNNSGTLLLSKNHYGIATVRSTSTWNKVLQIGERNSGIRDIHSDYSGNTIVTVSKNGITRVYNGKTGAFERELRQNINVKDEDFDKIKYCIAERTEKGTITITSSLTGKYLAEFTAQKTLPERVHYYTKEARFILWYDSIAEIRNSVTGALVTSFNKTDGYYSEVGFSPSGDALLVANTNCYELRSIFNGNKMYSKDYRNVKFISETKFYDGKYLVYSDFSNTVTLLNVINEKEDMTLKGHTGSVYSISFDKNGKYMVTGSDDSTARVWDMKTGKNIVVLKGHKGSVWASFDNEGKRVVTASMDGTVKVWNAFTGELIATLKGHKGYVYNAYFSDDDQTIITRSMDGVLRVYDANELPYSFTDIEEEIQTTMSLSPNPAQNEIRITFTEPIKESGEYTIVSPTGMHITKCTIEALSSGFTYRIDKSISNGTYLCIIRSGEKSFEEKFVVIR